MSTAGCVPCQHLELLHFWNHRVNTLTLILSALIVRASNCVALTKTPPTPFNSPFFLYWFSVLRFFISTSLLPDAPFSCSVVVGGHWEDVTAGWPTRWTQAIRGSPFPPRSLECTFLCSHSGSCFQRHSLIEQCVVETIWTIYVTEPH